MATPNSYNIINNVNFKFEISRAPNITYYSQDVILPSIQIDSPIFSMPKRDFGLPGTKPIFDNLNINFLVDEDLANYLEIYSWIMDAMATEDITKWYCDGTLHILSSNMNPVMEIRFYNLHPVMLAELPFTTSDPDAAPIQCTANFAYTHFEVIGKDVRMSENTNTQGRLPDNI